LVLVSLILTYCVFSLSGSVWPTLAVATLCGIASSRADLRFDPVQGEAPKQFEKRIWLILYVPALLLFGAGSIYTALHARDGFDVLKAGLSAGLFGWVLGFTIIVAFDSVSRARVEANFVNFRGPNR
jgi:hypothetical protein